jgi:enamine deaminase RidA (YjgF/YER057c/UK114 family)
MAETRRMQTGKRMSQAVIHNGLVYLAGQVGTGGGSTEQQTRDVLAKIDDLLHGAGTDKSRVLQAQIWLKSMDDFPVMNEVWDSWVPEGHAPTRACVEANLARPDLTVEIMVVAALP